MILISLLPVPSYVGTTGPPFFLVFLGKVRKEEEEEEFKKEELLLEEGAGKEGCLFRGTVFTCDWFSFARRI